MNKIEEPANMGTVKAADLSQLPDCPGLYWVVVGPETLYIGQSGSIRKRWKCHKHKHRVRAIPNAYIMWLRIPEKEIRLYVEARNIKRLRPTWNKQGPTPPKVFKHLFARAGDDCIIWTP